MRAAATDGIDGLAEAQRTRAKRNNLVPTEDGVALEFEARHAGRLLYGHERGCWFEWDGTRWRQDNTGLAFDRAREVARELSEGESPKTKATMNRTGFASGVERFARHARCFVAEEWDADPFLLGTPAGTVDLRTGRIMPADPRHRITKLAAVGPADQADCPIWLAFLHEATDGDAELVRFLRAWIGYCLTGDTREHALVFGYGPGGNGKSVFLNTVVGMMGDYAQTAAMDTFSASQSERHSTELAMLRGARLVTASETEEGRPWAEARIKQLTGGDPITARFMRQDNFTFRPVFKLMIVGNHKPVLKTVDDAARRRFNILPFIVQPKHPDPELETKLQAEWPAILRWAMDGCLDWQQHGLVRAASIIRATDTYFTDQDVTGQWLDEKCDAEPGNLHKSEAVGILFGSWSGYAKEAGEQPGSTKAFSENLQRRGFVKARMAGGVRIYRGVRLKPQDAFGSDR
jgi:putative DNA primase/helicase